MKLNRSNSHSTGAPNAPWIGRRRAGVAIFAALAVLLCSGSSGSTSGCQGGSLGTIGPSEGEVVGGAIGIVAVIAVAIIVPVEINKSHHRLKGCVFAGPNGFELQTSDARTYALEGDAATIKAGDLIQFHGSRVKKAKGSSGDPVFRVESLKRDYGPCHLQPDASAKSAQ